jgi:FkbM family methyltransferase
MKTAVIVGQNYPDKTLDELVKMHDRVIVFEPLSAAAVACREKYAGVDKVLVFEAACGKAWAIETLNIYNTNGLSSSLGEVTQQAKQVFASHDLSLINTAQVYVVNLGTVLDMLSVKFIDCLMIDAQGMDFAILKTIHWMIETSSIGYIQLEADGPGYRHYTGTPDNSEVAIVEWMSRYPQYQADRLPNRLDAHPDLVFTLSEK